MSQAETLMLAYFQESGTRSKGCCIRLKQLTFEFAAAAGSQHSIALLTV